MIESWHPPFCINPQCVNVKPAGTGWAVRRGSFWTDKAGAVPRFSCKACGRGMSASTFNIEFRTKYALPLEKIEQAIDSGEGVRSIGRSLKVHPDVIMSRLARLARQTIALQVEARDHVVATSSLPEPLVVDGLDSFVWSQYFPVSITILAGGRSQFCHLGDYSVERRRGRMTEAQRKRREELDAICMFPEHSLAQSCERIFTHAHNLVKEGKEPRVLDTDKHKQYVRTLKKILEPNDLMQHHRTSSKAPRTFRNPLMAANYLDRELRKDSANHTRETVQWSKEANNCMARFCLYMGTHNFLKPYRINQRTNPMVSHAEKAGVDGDFCRRARELIFGTRAFYSRLKGRILPSETMTWLRQWPNPHGAGVRRLWPMEMA